jgi:hypothetical protein
MSDSLEEASSLARQPPAAELGLSVANEICLDRPDHAAGVVTVYRQAKCSIIGRIEAPAWDRNFLLHLLALNPISMHEPCWQNMLPHFLMVTHCIVS